MKNSKKLFLSLSAFACVLGLAACGGTSTALPPSNSGSGSSTPSTSTPAPAENTFGTGITDDEKAFFPSLISGTGDFTKNTDFTATGSLTDRFDVKVGGTLKYIIYKGAKANGFGINITAYIGVDVSTLKISGFKTVGDVHSYDTSADISSLPLVGTDGNITVANGSMSGATVSANTLVDIAKEAVAQAKVDAGSSTAENTFGDGITADEKEIFPSLIKGTGDFTKNTAFTATGSLTDRFDVKVGDTLKYIIYKGSKANGFDINITAYIGVDVSTFQISGFKTVGAVHSYDTNADISSLPLVGTDGNITVENGSMGGATVSANTLVAIAKEAVAQAKVDTEEPVVDTDDVEVITSLAGNGTYTKDTAFTATDILTSRYVVTENGFVTKVIYKGHKLNSDRFKVDVTAYIAVDALTLKITGFKTVGTLHSANPDADVSALPLPGTDGNITVNDGDFGGGRTGASVSARAVVEIAKAAVAQATLDFPPLTSEETTALSTLISGEYTRHILANVTYDSTYVSNGKILVTDRFDAKEGNLTVYKAKIDKGWGTYLTAFVGVSTESFLVTGVEFTGTTWSQVPADQWTPPAGGLGDFNDKFVGTDGNITDGVTGLTQSTTIYKELVQAAVKQARVDFHAMTDEEKTAVSTLAGGATYTRTFLDVTYDSTSVTDGTVEVLERIDVTGKALVIYKVTIDKGWGTYLTTYVGVDTATFLITGVEFTGTTWSQVPADQWTPPAGGLGDFNDKFVGTDGNIEDTVTGLTQSTTIYKELVQTAVKQAKLDAKVDAILKTLAGEGTATLNTSFAPTNTLTARYDVTENGVVTKVIYKGEVLLKQGYYFTAYVAVDVNTHLITGYELLGSPVSSRWEEKGYAESFEGWEDKFVGTNGSTVTDTVAGATLTSNAFKNIAKDAVAQAALDFEPALSEEEKTALQTLAGTGTYEYNGTFTGTDTLTTRYDVKENGKVTKVIYKGKVLLKQGYYFTAYVAVDVNTHLITGYEVIGDVVSSAWTSHASSFEGWEDKFIGTDGSTDLENVAQATLTSNAFKNIAKAAVAQAIIDFE